jgi:hypothetical protein
MLPFPRSRLCKRGYHSHTNLLDIDFVGLIRAELTSCLHQLAMRSVSLTPAMACHSASGARPNSPNPEHVVSTRGIDFMDRDIRKLGICSGYQCECD